MCQGIVLVVRPLRPTGREPRKRFVAREADRPLESPQNLEIEADSVCAQAHIQSIPIGTSREAADTPQALHRQSRGLGANSAVFGKAKNAP